MIGTRAIGGGRLIPIGLRLGIDEKQLSADLTVMPLIWASDYRQIISYSQGAEFNRRMPAICTTRWHTVIMAINTKSPESAATDEYPPHDDRQRADRSAFLVG